jgi:sorbose reductase
MADMQDGKFVHDATTAPKGDRVLPLFSLKGKTAIVSGATSGIGLAVAQALAEAGANVAIWYKGRKEEAEQSAADVEKQYGVKCASPYPMRTISNTPGSPLDVTTQQAEPTK